MEEKTFIQKLIEIQSRLIVPKTKRRESQVKFAFRTCEEILTVAKPLCIERGLLLTLSDIVVMIGNRYYLESKATITDGTTTKESYGYCREPEKLQIMSECQTTGAASSYARKVALGGLFGLDDRDNDPDQLPQDDNDKPTNPQKPASAPIVADRELLVEKLTEQGKLENTLKWAKENYKCENIADLPDNVVISLLKRCEVQ